MLTLRLGQSADLIITFDIMSAGFPTVLANLVLNKKSILRLGGDFFWERDLNNEKAFCTLEDYYKERLYRRGIAFHIARFMMRQFSLVIFSTMFLQKMYFSAFPMLKGKTAVIHNPYPDTKRSVYCKNPMPENG